MVLGRAGTYQVIEFGSTIGDSQEVWATLIRWEDRQRFEWSAKFRAGCDPAGDPVVAGLRRAHIEGCRIRIREILDAGFLRLKYEIEIARESPRDR